MMQGIVLLQPGIVNAIQRQQYQTIQKLLKLWCSLQTVINKEGQTALQLAENLAKKNQNALRCLKIAIQDNLATNVSLHCPADKADMKMVQN
jgi:hypothetical protein